MKNQLGLYWALLAAWITLGSLMFDDKCCQSAPRLTDIPVKQYFSGILLTQDDLRIRTTNNFVFRRSSADFLTPVAPDVSEAMDSTASYLISHPSAKIRLVGRYHPAETSHSSQDLGMERARVIENVFLSKGVPQGQLLTFSLRDSLLPIKNDMVLAGFVPVIIPSP